MRDVDLADEWAAGVGGHRGPRARASRRWTGPRLHFVDSLLIRSGVPLEDVPFTSWAGLAVLLRARFTFWRGRSARAHGRGARGRVSSRDDAHRRLAVLDAPVGDDPGNRNISRSASAASVGARGSRADASDGDLQPHPEYCLRALPVRADCGRGGGLRSSAHGVAARGVGIGCPLRDGFGTDRVGAGHSASGGRTTDHRVRAALRVQPVPRRGPNRVAVARVGEVHSRRLRRCNHGRWSVAEQPRRVLVARRNQRPAPARRASRLAGLAHRICRDFATGTCF